MPLLHAPGQRVGRPGQGHAVPGRRSALVWNLVEHGPKRPELARWVEPLRPQLRRGKERRGLRQIGQIKQAGKVIEREQNYFHNQCRSAKTASFQVLRPVLEPGGVAPPLRLMKPAQSALG